MTDSPAAVSLAHYLRDLLKNAVRDTTARMVLFSGGLDTAVLAHLASRLRGLGAITVTVGGNPPDKEFAVRAAKHFGITHVLVSPTHDDLLGLLPQTIKLLKTYDPMTLRNTLPVHTALLMAKEMNVRTVLSGDGADELFAGYSFFFDKPLEELPDALRRLWKVMSFSGIELARRLGMEVQAPYLSPMVREFAEKVPPGMLLAERDGKIFGKAILRQAFEGEIPEDILWREKCPAEFGSGTSGLTKALEQKISDEECERQQGTFWNVDSVRIRNKEQLYYYRLYRAQFGPPKGVKASAGQGRSCPDCGTPVAHKESDFCLLCGAWPVP
ncbi:MAG TPA: asparagine synthase C-terminal domain-containing protein [Elusimicrobiota bacterium]|nr:asparagine synthase C-terminal domain-containing protein [Elusimicrobiota bacterium]